MSKKRRMFEIDLPDEPLETKAKTFPAGKVETKSDAPRRGPMATAIAENSASLQDRATAEAAIRAENDALAHEHVRLKKLGLIVDRIDLDLIDMSKLVRDRGQGVDAELDELKTSIQEIGLSNPIRVEAAENGRYELVQGFRRLSAFRELLAATGDSEAFGAIPAGIVAKGVAKEGLYRRMIDENLVRKDISFAEMAVLALRYAQDEGTELSDPDKVVKNLFKSASYQKRSYIRSFVRLMDVLGDDLDFADQIPRSLGLSLVKKLEEDPSIAGQIKDALKPRLGRTADTELGVLRQFAGQGGEAETFPAGKVLKKDQKQRVAKTTFQLDRPSGAAKCTASDGRLEIRLPKDFSAMDRLELEAAVAALLDRLEDGW